VALEALLRWQHPEQGLLLPDQFIPIAEETGLIREIGNFVLQTGCHQMVAWHKRCKKPPTLSVNMSSQQFIFNDFITPITQALETSGLPAESLMIEVTESLTLDPVDKVVHKLSQLKKMGVGLAIDDFGTGYSSLSYLARFPIDRLKIDKSFIHDIASNPQKTDIVEAIIRMGQSMKMKIIAEGIEKEEELRCVKKLGCDAAQGHYFSKPLSVEAYDQVLSE
jgi:EAL domain-containing protein (putative c-di-GMP-specific phosphodiesterase class I)